MRYTTSFPSTNTDEENAIFMAEQHQENINPEHGLFFDFPKTYYLKARLDTRTQGLCKETETT